MSEKKREGYLRQVFITQTNGYINVRDKREFWQEVSNEFKGEFKISHNSGNELEILKIYIPYKNWKIKLTESDTKPLKFEISFVSDVDYKLIIEYEDSIEKILKRLGKREVEVGNSIFDAKYLINSSDSEMARRIVNQDVIENFIKYNIYSLSYTTDLIKQASKLISVISRTIDDKSIIEELIRFHMRIIDNLKELMLIK